MNESLYHVESTKAVISGIGTKSCSPSGKAAPQSLHGIRRYRQSIAFFRRGTFSNIYIYIYIYRERDIDMGVSVLMAAFLGLT